jgi:hypothetical protein
MSRLSWADQEKLKKSKKFVDARREKVKIGWRTAVAEANAKGDPSLLYVPGTSPPPEPPDPPEGSAARTDMARAYAAADIAKRQKQEHDAEVDKALERQPTIFDRSITKADAFKADINVSSGASAPKRWDRTPMGRPATARLAKVDEGTRIRLARLKWKMQHKVRPADFPERQWDACQLVYGEGLPDAEAGQRMGGVTKGAVAHLRAKAAARGLPDPRGYSIGPKVSL